MAELNEKIKEMLVEVHKKDQTSEKEPRDKKADLETTVADRPAPEKKKKGKKKKAKK